MARDHREVVERGLRLKKAGNALIDGRRRPRDPPDQRPGRRLLPRADPRASCAPCASSSSAARETRSRPCAGPRRFDFPDFEQRLRVRRAAPTRRATRSSAGASSPARGLDIAVRRVRRALRRGAGRRTRPRCTPACASAAPTSSARWPATPSTSTGSRRSPARRPPRPDSGASCRNPFRSIVVRAVEILYACDEALRLIDAYEPPDPPGGRRSSRGPAVGYGWHRGAARAALPPLRARRRRHDPRRADRPADLAEPGAAIEQDLRAFVGAGLDLHDDELQLRVRAGDPQLRPLHLLRDALPRARGGPRVSGAAARDRHRQPAARRRRRRPRGRPPVRSAAAPGVAVVELEGEPTDLLDAVGDATELVSSTPS